VDRPSNQEFWYIAILKRTPFLDVHTFLFANILMSYEMMPTQCATFGANYVALFVSI